MTNPKKSKGRVWDQAEEMLCVHREHAGVYRRVANQLKVDPSFVSRVRGPVFCTIRDLSRWHKNEHTAGK